jgi:hypothetical protein
MMEIRLGCLPGLGTDPANPARKKEKIRKLTEKLMKKYQRPNDGYQASLVG